MNNVAALVQIVALRLAISFTNDGTFTDDYLRHSVSVS